MQTQLEICMNFSKIWLRFVRDISKMSPNCMKWYGWENFKNMTGSVTEWRHDFWRGYCHNQAPSWILSLASFSLQDGATKWYYNHWTTQPFQLTDFFGEGVIFLGQPHIIHNSIFETLIFILIHLFIFWGNLFLYVSLIWWGSLILLGSPYLGSPI